MAVQSASSRRGPVARVGTRGSFGAKTRRLRPPRTGAFTLVELLIVVAIIALLVMLIAPSLGRAREMARQAGCMTAQANIVKALISYHSEHKGFPYNYGGGAKWALCYISEYAGGPPNLRDLRNLDEGQFPRTYICPSADLDAVYLSNPSDKYHACYWTNVAIRYNRGFGGAAGGLFDTHGHEGMPAGWDIDSGGEARILARLCNDVSWSHWRSVYHPTLDSIDLPSQVAFTGDTNNGPITTILGADGQAYPLYHPTYPGEWHTRPGWGWVYGSLGFDRHMDNLVMSYLDGSAHARSHAYLDKNFAHWPPQHGEKELTGDFMLRYPDEWSCHGSQIHRIPEAKVEW